MAPAAVVHKAVLLKQANDLHTGSLTQMALTDVVTHLPQSHVAMLCETYGARRDALLKALGRHMPEGVTWTKPQGGMFVWLPLPKAIDATRLLPKAVEAGVAFVLFEVYGHSGQEIADLMGLLRTFIRNDLEELVAIVLVDVHAHLIMDGLQHNHRRRQRVERLRVTCLDLVGELVAVRPEDLDAVVLIGIVRG